MTYIRYTLLCLLLAAPAQAQVICGNVVSVYDGDTITLDTGEKIRLEGIDAPEIGSERTPEKWQPYGREARDRLRNILLGKHVAVDWSYKSWGRPVGVVYLDGKDINLFAIRYGLAWHAPEYSQSKKYAQAHINAKADRLGLWLDGSPIAPWDWRATRR